MFTAALALSSLSGVAHAQQAGDATKGRALFLQCVACHSTTAGAPHKVGPNLSGIHGARSGTRAGYTYSPAMRAANIRWDDQRLLAFMQNPAGVVPRNKMVFGGIADPVKRANLLAYIKTLK